MDKNFEMAKIVSNEEMDKQFSIYLEEEDNSLEVAGTWASAGTFGSTIGGCASTVGSASSFG